MEVVVESPSAIQISAAEKPSDLPAILRKIIANPRVHGRFLALLARLEYVGARKIAKALPASAMGAHELEHWSEEVGHALVLRREAERLLGSLGEVDHVLLDEAESYLQILDTGIAQILKEHCGAYQVHLTYLATSLIIEERAMKFYPRYHHELPTGTVKEALAAVIDDEVGHLEEMRANCSQTLSAAVLEQCRRLEAKTYETQFFPLLQRLALEA